jgi:cellulose synthase/poly-beta-1,6-N-acetylglucosamine synthase-like glycosyltransferase
MGNRWVSTMMSRWSASTDFILGIGLYHRQPGLLNLMIQAETQYTAWLYGSAAMLGFPYMAVGRNLAVRRAVLLGFARGDVFWQTPSGSDDLVVNHLGTRHNTRVCIHPEAYTHSNPKQTWHDWLTQKSRHTQGSTGYSLASRAALLVWEATHLGGVLWLGLQSVSLLIGWLVLKNLGFLPFYHSFNILWGILVEICHLIYLIFVCIVLPFYPRTWKLNSPVHPELKRTAP